MSLEAIVALYRACGRPLLDDAFFSGAADFNRVRALVCKVKNDNKARFDELEVDGIDVLNESFPELGKKIKFRLRLPTGSSSTFHLNLAALLAIEPRVSRGEEPTDYYLVDEDYYCGETERPESVKALGRVCRLICGLSKLAPYHDKKPSSGHLRLVFIQPTQERGVKPVELETTVTMAVVNAAMDLEPRLVEELSESSAANDPHYTAKVGVFGTSLAAFVGSRPAGSAFEYLVTHWKEFVAEYQRDLSTYLSGFAFHKAKTEVAEAELKIAGEFSKVLSDITGKLLSIPLTIAAISAIPRADTFFERSLLLLGIIVASFTISRTVANQKRQFNRIKNAKELVLGAIQGKRESYPKELAEIINKMGESLERDEKGLQNSLTFFCALSWLPLIIAFVVLCYLYRSDLAIFVSMALIE